MNFKLIFAIYRKELTDALRDRRTMMSTVIVPALVIPLITLAVTSLATKLVAEAQLEIPDVMLLGGQDSAEVAAELQKEKALHVLAETADWQQLISDKKLKAAVQIPPHFQADLAHAAAQPIVIYHYEGEMKSAMAAHELEAHFQRLQQQTVQKQLSEKGIPFAILQPFALRLENVVAAEKVDGNLLGGMIPYVILILCLTGAMVPAMDTTAGEKERGTLETLLCAPASRMEIVLGKFLLVLTGSLSAMALSVLSMSVSAALVGRMATQLGETASNMAGTHGGLSGLPALDPVGAMAVIAMIFPLAVLFSAVTLAIGVFAKTYKEAQSYISPLVFLVILPAVVGMLPGVELDWKLCFVPILSVSLVCKEMLSGIWHFGNIALVFGLTCVYAALALHWATRMFSREDVIFRT